MSKLFRTAQLAAITISIAAVALVTLSDRSPQEEWSFYCGKDASILKKYSQLEQCNAAMKESSGCGCRRTDGPYAFLNKVADLAFGALN